MSQFFTFLDKSGTKFVGVVHDSNTNQVLFRSAEHDSQETALNEVNQFVATFKSASTSETITTTNTAVVSETPPQPQPAPVQRRCCGR